MNDVRPPAYWNFFEDCAEHEKVQHVLRYNADPTKSYVDKRMDLILNNIMEIGNNLKGYEEIKWTQLVSMVHDIFDFDY